MIYFSFCFDFVWLNKDSCLFLECGYLFEGIIVLDCICYIVEYVERKLGIEGYVDKFFYYMVCGYFLFLLLIWLNFGLDCGLLIFCFGSYIGDFIYEIMEIIVEVGMMSKIGGGILGYFGDICLCGLLIRNNGKLDGLFNFSKLFDIVIDVIF